MLSCVGAAIGVHEIDLGNGLKIGRGWSDMTQNNNAGWGVFTSSNLGKKLNTTYNLNAFTELELDIDVGDVTVQEGSEWKLKVTDVWENPFSYKYEGSKLKVQYETDNKYNNNKLFNNNSNMKTSFLLTIPKGTRLTEFSLDCGVGDTKVQKINAIQFDLGSGVGDSTINDCTAAQMELSSGVGTITGSGILVEGSAELSSGVGDICLSGEFRGTIDIGGGLGDISLDLENCSEADYSYDVSGGMGDIWINGKNVEWGGSMNRNDANASRYLTISGGMGEINVSFDGTASKNSSGAGVVVESYSNKPNVPPVPPVPEVPSLPNSGGNGWKGLGSLYDDGDGERLTIDMYGKIKDFSGTYILLSETASKTTHREISYEIEDTSGQVELVWTKPDGTKQILSTGSVDGSSNISIPAGKNTFALAAPSGVTVKVLKAEIDMDD